MLLLKAKEIKLPQNRKPNKRESEHQKPARARVSICCYLLLPAEQWHLNPPDRSSQVEPCWHRPSTQCFMGVWQRGPVCPCWHTHLYVFAISSQWRVPSGLQGFDLHNFRGEEQSAPRYPGKGGIKGVIDAARTVSPLPTHMWQTPPIRISHTVVSAFQTICIVVSESNGV